MACFLLAKKWRERGWARVSFFFSSDKTDEDDSASATYQAVSELPQANRDTLAFLMVHLQK